MCLKIFIARIMDVSLGTIRTVMTVKNKNILAMTIGFFEITIWFLVVKDALSSNDNGLWITFAYASGFSAGTYIGGFIANKFIHGKLSVQIIMNETSNKFIDILRNEGYAVSIIPLGDNNKNKKYMLFLEIDSRQLDHLRKIIREYDKNAFVVVNETKQVFNGYFSQNK